MDEHDVVEAGTDLLFGDPKSVLKKIGLSILDKKQFEAIFVSAGKTVAEYEKDNTEQNDIRRILFCEETMRLLANEIRKSITYGYMKLYHTLMNQFQNCRLRIILLHMILLRIAMIYI